MPSPLTVWMVPVLWMVTPVPRTVIVPPLLTGPLFPGWVAVMVPLLVMVAPELRLTAGFEVDGVKTPLLSTVTVTPVAALLEMDSGQVPLQVRVELLTGLVIPAVEVSAAGVAVMAANAGVAPARRQDRPMAMEGFFGVADPENLFLSSPHGCAHLLQE